MGPLLFTGWKFITFDDEKICEFQQISVLQPKFFRVQRRKMKILERLDRAEEKTI